MILSNRKQQLTLIQTVAATLMFVCYLFRRAAQSMNSVFVRLGRGVGEKLLGLEAPMARANFVVNSSLRMRQVAHNLQKTLINAVGTSV
jgi:hypothetical protein